jgi:hypothetical protein
MRPLRRLLLAALLAGLVLGCQSKPSPVGSEDGNLNPQQRKIKKAQEEPEGPQLRP